MVGFCRAWPGVWRLIIAKWWKVDSDSYIQFKTRRQACKSLINLFWVHFRTFPFQSSVTHFVFCVLQAGPVFANARQLALCNFDWILLCLPKLEGIMNFIIFIGKKLCCTFHLIFQPRRTIYVHCILCSGYFTDVVFDGNTKEQTILII